MDNWDDEDFEPASPTRDAVGDKWAGEDEEDDLKENWDDEEEEEKPKEEPKPEVKKGGKRYLQQKLKEREAEKQKEAEQRRLQQESKTPEEIMEERLRAQKLAEESELAMLKGQFSSDNIDPDKLTIDSMKPRTKEDFIKFSQLLQDKLTSLEDSPHYFFLLETVISASIVKLDSESLKKLTLPINALANEKLKLEKQKKGGKKSQKAKLGGGIKSSRNEALDDFSQYDDYDDFM